MVSVSGLVFKIIFERLRGFEFLEVPILGGSGT